LYETIFPFKSSSLSTTASHVLNIFDFWLPYSYTLLESSVLPQMSASINSIALPSVDSHCWQSTPNSPYDATVTGNVGTDFNDQPFEDLNLPTLMSALNSDIHPKHFLTPKSPHFINTTQPHEALVNHPMLARSKL
jgi:hypothetical protein